MSSIKKYRHLKIVRLLFGHALILMMNKKMAGKQDAVDWKFLNIKSYSIGNFLTVNSYSIENF